MKCGAGHTNSSQHESHWMWHHASWIKEVQSHKVNLLIHPPHLIGPEQQTPTVNDECTMWIPLLLFFNGIFGSPFFSELFCSINKPWTSWKTSQVCRTLRMWTKIKSVPTKVKWAYSFLYFFVFYVFNNYNLIIHPFHTTMHVSPADWIRRWCTIAQKNQRKEWASMIVRYNLSCFTFFTLFLQFNDIGVPSPHSNKCIGLQTESGDELADAPF